MNAPENHSQTLQENIVTELGVQPCIDIPFVIRRRVDFLCDQLVRSNRRTLVLGISGGVDSLVGGYLSQHAAVQLREQHKDGKFIAVRLPYGTQADEKDAQKALAAISPDVVLTVDIKPASDAMLQALMDGGLSFTDAFQQDFVMGNIKARQRMIAQYAIAGAHDGLVVGTDHAAEALMGFFTKHGDGAADVTPLAGLNKRQVRAIAAYCGAQESLVNKVPTADLETLSPLKPDEAVFGISYAEIDNFLEGKPVNQQTLEKIVQQFQKTAHKRQLPAAPSTSQS